MNTWTEYPKWARELKQFLEDTILDHIAEDGSEDAITDQVKDATLAMICETYGHCVTDDQCGFPHHRYCEMCNELMPNIEPGHYVSPTMMTGIWPKEAGRDTVDLADVIPPYHNHTREEQMLFTPAGQCPGCDHDVEHEVGWIRGDSAVSPAPYPEPPDA